MLNNRYLLFFAILAVGLAFSWTLVGKRAQLEPGASLYVMTTEDSCRPYLSPCAAYAADFALVLGPQADALRLQAERLPSGAVLEFSQFEDGAQELEIPQTERLASNAWLIRPVLRTGRLRVNVLIANQQWLAEFPLVQ